VSRYAAVAFLTFALSAASAAGAAEKTLDRTFTVSPGGLLTVDADGATVKISGADTRQVTVHMSARGSDEDLADTTLEAAQSGEGVKVTLRRRDKGSWFSSRSWSSEERIEVTVPRQYQISVRTGGGGIELRDTVGAATLKTSGGDISARNVKGDVELRTSGGGILADTIRGNVDADTSGGDVRVLHVDGMISANTSGGSVRCSLVGANRGISATTSGGDIDLTLPAGTTGNVEASTSGGDVTSDLPIRAAVRKDGRLEGDLNGGGPPIRARTSGGSISLRSES
jgi:DUF4097 and DUF4098 domain-containing protein YvlB